MVHIAPPSFDDHEGTLKIAVWHNLPSGGGMRALYDQVLGLQQRGHYLEAWCPATAENGFLALGRIMTERRLDLPWPPGLPALKKLGRPYWLPVARLQAMEEHCGQVVEQIARDSFDVLLAHPCRFFRTSAVGRLSPIPSVLYLQEPCRHLYEASPRLNWIGEDPDTDTRKRNPRRLFTAAKDLLSLRAQRVQARAEVRDAAGFDSILSNSLYSRESILRAYGLESSVCYPGVDTDRFRRLDREVKDQVVSVGYLNREKNVELVIRSVATMPTPPPVLVWVANGVHQSYFSRMCSLATELGVDFRPKISVSDDELLTALAESFAFVYAPRLEPFGLAALEANACELPVVAVAEGGIRETVVDGVNGLLVQSKPEYLAGALQDLRVDRTRAIELGRRGRQMVRERWSTAAAAERLEAKLVEAIASADGDLDVTEAGAVSDRPSIGNGLE